MPDETNTTADPSQDSSVGITPAPIETAAPEVDTTNQEAVVTDVTPPSEPETADAPEEASPSDEPGAIAPAPLMDVATGQGTGDVPNAYRTQS